MTSIMLGAEFGDVDVYCQDLHQRPPRTCPTECLQLIPYFLAGVGVHGVEIVIVVGDFTLGRKVLVYEVEFVRRFLSQFRVDLDVKSVVVPMMT